jgi:hypothetical protein
LFVAQLDSETVQGLAAAHKNKNTAIAVCIASRFQPWVEAEVVGTNDPWFRMMLNFLLVGYRLLRDGICSGDPIILEAVLLRFTQVWCLIGKNKCLEVVLRRRDFAWRVGWRVRGTQSTGIGFGGLEKQYISFVYRSGSAKYSFLQS